MQNARQQNSEPHQLRTSPSRDDHVEEHIKTGGLHDEEDACSTPYHNFSPSPQYRPVLGVRHSTHATSAGNVRSATPPPRIVILSTASFSRTRSISVPYFGHAAV
ncbi:hypothetical protein DSO57_1019145 [Entomophthora muscae]|uniref:Uncharacterized protein n=1 Tax=Entomophthora muscae TaxID=34485 RepID=A0ACC2RVE3_9FUNG|nr:hypothetical protein DSO57_1019145 [Entomophthora muscae]